MYEMMRYFLVGGIVAIAVGIGGCGASKAVDTLNGVPLTAQQSQNEQNWQACLNNTSPDWYSSQPCRDWRAATGN